jgi:spore germination protein KC
MKKLLSAMLCVLLTATLLLGGCTPSYDLNELSIVEGIGVDKLPDGSYLITFQVFKPSTGGGGGNQTTTNETEVMQSTGKSLFDASRNVTKQMGKKLYYSNVQALIIGKDVCLSDFPKLMDFFERNHEIVPSERVFMAEDKAEDILTAKNADGYISARDISLISQNSQYTSMVVDQPLYNIEKRQAEGTTDFALPVLSVKKGKSQSSSSGSSGGGNDILTINSMAVFSNNKLAGTLDPSETRGMLWMRETVEVKSGVIVVNTAEGGNASMEIIGSATKQTVASQGGEPCMNVDIGFTTRLAETQADVSSLNDDFFKELKTLQEKAVMDEAESALKLALQQDRSDVFDFGEKIYTSKPQL